MESTLAQNITNNVTTTQHTDKQYAVLLICGIIQAMVSLVGIVGNTLNITVLVKLVRKPQHIPIYHLLLAIGIADLIALLFAAIYSLSMFTRWPPLLFQNLSDEHSNYIHLVMMTWFIPANIFSLASTWCIVALTVFRFLAVIFPMRVSYWCTVWRVRLSIVLIFVCALIINIPEWLTLTVVIHEEGRLRFSETPLYDQLSTYYTIYQVVEVGIPVVINSILVAAIIKNLYVTRHNIHDLVTNSHAVAKEKEHQRIGFMLVAIVILFVICYIPQLCYVILREFQGEERLSNESLYTNQVFSMISTIFILINQSANVFLYCLVNKQYRKNFTATLLTFEDMYRKCRLLNSKSSVEESAKVKSMATEDIELKPSTSADNNNSTGQVTVKLLQTHSSVANS